VIRSAVVLGASGAVGGELLRGLLDSPLWTRVSTLGRRPAALSPSEDSRRLEQHVVDVADPASYEPLLAGHTDAFCTFGVGQISRMTREEFRRVDFDYVLAFARACRRQGVTGFTLLTSVGADPKSRVFYLRCKGELEAAIKGLGFGRTHFFRPSMILTPTNRYGLSQAVTLKLWPMLDVLLAGPLRKYRGVLVRDLGRAMARHAERDREAGNRVYMWDDFKGQ
jgi:uncharacterized protein YbjT (DUF2867 family)